MKTHGYQRARLLQTQLPGGGRKAADDGLDRHQAGGLAVLMDGYLDVRIIQQLLGHAKLETTQVYTEVSIKLLQDVHARTHPASQAATSAA